MPTTRSQSSVSRVKTTERARLNSTPNLGETYASNFLNSIDLNFEDFKSSLIFPPANATKMASREAISAQIEKKIPIFLGTESVDDIHLFIDRCKSFEAKYNTEGNQQLLPFVLEEIIDRLAGKAYGLFREQDIHSFQQFYEFINSKFLPQISIHQLHDSLVNAKQDTNENISSFATRLKSLSDNYHAAYEKKYGGKIPQTHVQEELIRAFKKGLRKQEVRNFLHHLIGKSFQSIVRSAESIEAECLGLIEPGPKCQLCEKTNHTAKDCDLLNNIQSKFPINPEMGHKTNERTPYREHLQNSHLRYNNTLFCKYCKRSGHSIEFCRTKPRSPQLQYTRNQTSARKAPEIHPSLRKQDTFHRAPPQNMWNWRQTVPNYSDVSSPIKKDNHNLENRRFEHPLQTYRQNQNAGTQQLEPRIEQMNINYVSSSEQDTPTSENLQGNDQGFVN